MESKLNKSLDKNLDKIIQGHPILDATCGSRMMWFDKKNPACLYIDRRQMHEENIWKSTKNDSFRTCTVEPDIMADFTNMPFDDNTFYHVVFDPPHLVNLSETAWLCKKYGSLPNSWENVIYDGFWECMRVLRPNGTLIFKWAETQISVQEIIQVIKCEPLYGFRGGKNMKTIWMAFMKGVSDEYRFD